MVEKRVLVSVVVASSIGLLVAASACVGDSNPITDGGGTDTSTCAKVCNDTCVSGNDPATGCGGTDCAACPTLVHQASVCTAGACAAGACAPGYLDCDPKVPGCETQEDINNCGKCGNVCGNTNTTGMTCGAPTAGDAGAGDASSDAASGGDGGTTGTVACQFACNGAYAHCSTNDSTGCETNISTDQNNCGACGHSCLGGQCVAGQCQAAIVTGSLTTESGFFVINGLVVNNGTIYGTDWYDHLGGTIFSVASNATAATPTWIVPDPGANGVATTVIATNNNKLVYSVYRTSDKAAGIWTVDFDGKNDTNVIAGGTDQQTCGATIPGTDVASIAFDTSYIYWTHDRTAGSPCQGIYRADPNGQNVALHQSSTYLRSLLSDGSGTIYMVSHDGTYPNYYGIAVLATTGATIDNAPVVIAQQGHPHAVQFDAQYVYWDDLSNSHFYRTTKVPSTIEDITPTTGMQTLGGSPFLVDATSIYFWSPYPGAGEKLYRMPKDGSAPPKAIFTMPGANDFPTGFTQDTTALYWANYPNSDKAVLFRLAK
jgi:hypothetical protein